MTWFVLGFSTALTTLIAAAMYLMPSVVTGTLPLGVSVPAAHAHDQVVVDAVRRYRAWVLVAWAAGLVAAITLAPTAQAAAIVVSVFVAFLVGTVAYVAQRRSIIEAKRDEGWYEGVRVRLAADVTSSAVRQSARPAWIFTTIATAILAVVAAIGVARYPSMPSTLVTHWNASGAADGYSHKSVWVVFSPLVIAFLVNLLLFGISLSSLAPGSRTRLTADENPERTAARAAQQRLAMRPALGWVQIVLAAGAGWTAVVTWLQPDNALPIILGSIALLILVVAIAVVMIIRFYRANRSAAPAGRSPRVDAPDDDRYWRGGLFYINRDDPAVFVPKRFGVGYTINFGSTGGIMLGVLFLAVIVTSLVVGTIAG